MKTVRQRILEFIHSQRAVTVYELKQAFRMSEQNARYHLSILVDEGLIEVIEQKSGAGRGRPANVYAPAGRSYGDNLDILAAGLFHIIMQNAAEEDAGAKMDELADFLAQRMSVAAGESASQSQPSKHLTSQLNRLTQILNQFHYQSRWEAHIDAPRLILGRCPYASIIHDHPELCQMDARLIALLLGKTVYQTAKLNKDSSGLLYCMFRVNEERV